MKNKFIVGFIIGLAGGALITMQFATAFIDSGIFMSQVNRQSTVEESTDTTSTEDGESKNAATQDEIDSKLSLLEKYIDTYYLEEVDESAYADGIYKGLLSSLDDPYSTYYTAKEYAAMQESSSGTYCGIGATVSQDSETGIITIVKPFLDGPAYKVGILPGDILYKVNKEEVTGVDISQVVSKMKGKEGTKVEIQVIRGSETEPRTFNIKRGTIEVPTIAYEMLEGKIGYIAIAEFDEVTSAQFRAALDDLEKQGEKGLVIDLRNNPGGRLDAVVDMLDRMLPKGMIVSTKDKNGKGDEFPSTDKEQFNKPLSVLINGNSASASEIFAGAIQDYKLGILVGTTSFGKGIVQSVMPLKDGTAIKLTTSKYYTPNGRNIHGTGIEPDVEIKLDESLKQKVVIEKEDDNQLQKAIEIVKDKIK